MPNDDGPDPDDRSDDRPMAPDPGSYDEEMGNPNDNSDCSGNIPGDDD